MGRARGVRDRSAFLVCLPETCFGVHGPRVQVVGVSFLPLMQAGDVVGGFSVGFCVAGGVCALLGGVH